MSNTYKLQQQQALTGLFKNGKAIYRACEVLTDFGYPKEAANMIAVDGKWYGIERHSKRVLNFGSLGIAG